MWTAISAGSSRRGRAGAPRRAVPGAGGLRRLGSPGCSASSGPRRCSPAAAARSRSYRSAPLEREIELNRKATTAFERGQHRGGARRLPGGAADLPGDRARRRDRRESARPGRRLPGPSATREQAAGAVDEILADGDARLLAGAALRRRLPAGAALHRRGRLRGGVPAGGPRRWRCAGNPRAATRAGSSTSRRASPFSPGTGRRRSPRRAGARAEPAGEGGRGDGELPAHRGGRPLRARRTGGRRSAGYAEALALDKKLGLPAKIGLDLLRLGDAAAGQRPRRGRAGLLPAGAGGEPRRGGRARGGRGRRAHPAPGGAALSRRGLPTRPRPAPDQARRAAATIACASCWIRRRCSSPRKLSA